MYLSPTVHNLGYFKAYLKKKLAINLDGKHRIVDEHVDFLLPYSLSFFKLGTYPYTPFVHPTELPMEHPDFCTFLNEAEKTIIRNRDGKIFTLTLSSDFEETGQYYIVSHTDDPETDAPISEPKTSIRRTKEQLDKLVNACISAGVYSRELFRNYAYISQFTVQFEREGDRPLSPGELSEIKAVVGREVGLKDLQPGVVKLLTPTQLNPLIFRYMISPRIEGVRIRLIKVHYHCPSDLSEGYFPIEALDALSYL